MKQILDFVNRTYLSARIWEVKIQLGNLDFLAKTSNIDYIIYNLNLRLLLRQLDNLKQLKSKYE